MNRINSDAEFCGKVPLHQTNLVQPHGVLLIIDRSDLSILQASENVTAIFGKSAAEIVEKPLQDFIGGEQATALQKRFAAPVNGLLPFTFTFPEGKHLASIQVSGNSLIVEIELQKRTAVTDDSFIAVYQELKYAMSAVEASDNTEETCRIAIEELKKISGFDKIMVYKFDEDWNGDVIAEVKEEGMDAYLGLKFPASDIPRQARELYRKTPYRLIPNVDYEPVRLYPVINPATGAFTDLSNSNLRSVAGVHIEYLRNMGVVASMSTRILVDGALWGLIACHHRSPKYLSFEMCSMFELLSNIISAKIASVQKEEQFGYRNDMQDLYTELVEDIYREGNLPLAIHNRNKELLKLLNADGISLVMNKQIDSYGAAPSDSEVEEMVLWLQSSHASRLYHQPSLGSVYEPAEKYAGIASGILALPIQGERGNFILAFRPEVLRKVNWGGNPNEAIRFEPDQKNYHPRNSFKIWQQTVQQTSVPWRQEEIEAAEQFRNFVVDYTLNKMYS